MSLILEALRKRQEEERAARAGGGIAYTRRPRRRSAWPVVLAVVVAAGLGAVGAFLALRQPADAPGAARSAPATSDPVTATSAPSAPSAHATETPALEVAGERAAQPPLDAASQPSVATSATPTAPAPPPALVSPPAESANAPLRPAAPSAAAQAPAPTTATIPNGQSEPSQAHSRPGPATTAPPPSAGPATSPENPALPLRTATRSILATDGTALELGGIAFSEGGPVALLNGRPVGPGESVSGYRVVTITPDSLELEGHGERILLELPR